MMTGQDTKDIIDFAYWFPLIEAAGLPVPKTEIVHTDLELWPLLDGEPVPGFGELTAEICAAIDRIGGYPCFLRNGHTSGKHSWEQTCFVPGPDRVMQHVFNLIEESACSDIWGCQTWAVRQLLPTTPLFTAFHGNMPITREFRVFVRDGVVEYLQPYWPAEAFQLSYPAPSAAHWETILSDASTLTGEEENRVTELALRASAAVPGYWSVDLLQGSNGSWYVTDMAPGAVSYRADTSD